MVVNFPVPVVAGVLFGIAWNFALLQKTRKLIARRRVRERTPSAVKSKRKTVSSRRKRRTSQNIVILRSKRESSAGAHGDGLPSPLSTQEPKQTVDDTQTGGTISRVFLSCDVRNSVKFNCAVPFWKQMTARKIAEGSYGEIYSFRHVDGSDRVFKCIPVNGRYPEGKHMHMPLIMTIPDIVASKCLSNLNEGTDFIAPNFPVIYSVSLVRDRFPELLTKAWWAYKRSPNRYKDPVEHPQPDLYEENQMYLTIESSFCGTQLAHKALRNAWLGASVLTQVVAALAVAEAAHCFEHRDLHLGNVLLRPTDAPALHYSIHSCNFAVTTAGHHAYIIDFTLARIYHENNVYSVPLDQMVNSGGSKEAVENFWLDHRNMYGLMAEFINGSWDTYTPVSNIIWVKHLSECILEKVEQSNPRLAEALTPNTESSDQMRALRLLRRWNDAILHYRSAGHLLLNLMSEDNPLCTFQPAKQ